MTAIDELVDLVRTTEAAASAGVVGIGRRGRGTGFVVAPGQGRHQRPQPARSDRRRCTSPTDGPCRATVAGSDLDGDLVVLDVDTGDVGAARHGRTTPSRPAMSSSP